MNYSLWYICTLEMKDNLVSGTLSEAFMTYVLEETEVYLAHHLNSSHTDLRVHKQGKHSVTQRIKIVLAAEL